MTEREMEEVEAMAHMLTKNRELEAQNASLARELHREYTKRRAERDRADIVLYVGIGVSFALGVIAHWAVS